MVSRQGAILAGRSGRAALAAAVVAVVALIALAVHAQPSAARPRHRAAQASAARLSALDPRITGVLRRTPNREIEAIAEFRPAVPVARARHDIAVVGGRIRARLHLIPAMAVDLTAREARRLAANPDLVSVSLNAEVRSSDWSGQETSVPDYGTTLGNTYPASLDVPALWRHGVTGAGVGVAVIDTGVDGDLPDFQRADGVGSRVIATAVTNPAATNAQDGYGHGTFVAGIIAGDSAARPAGDPLRDQFVGVAPGANIVAIKVADDQGNATVLDVIYGLQFAVDFQRQYNIRVVNLSLDADTPQSYRLDPLDAAVEAAWMHGITVVAAAGNRGSASDAVQYAPANDPYVITVGAVDENGSGDVAQHTIAPWSSRGVTQDGFAKPDVYAPGAHIVSELAPGSVFSTACPTCIIDGQYIKASGTSFSTPMIAGLVADLLQIHPDWTPDQVKGALTDPAAWASPTPEIDAVKAAAVVSPPLADQHLTPNTLVDGVSGNIDYTRSSWSRSSWSETDFSRSSWSLASTDAASLSRSSWSAMSWSSLPN